MNSEKREKAAHTPRLGLMGVRLRSGPWDGKEVWVPDPQAELVQISGPRHGNHCIWITHLYK
jgi:hypothetical protein